MPVGPPTPQVPSTQYDVQPCDPTKVYYVSLKGGKFLTLTKAASSCRIDYAEYTSTIYRDIIDSNFLGRASTGIMKVFDSTFTTVDYPGLNAATSVASGGDFVMELLDDSIATPIPDQAATMMEQSDPFTHTAPRMELSGRTMILWYDAITSGTPNTIPLTAKIVGRCWSDRYEGDSNAAIPQILGSVPPVFVPASP